MSQMATVRALPRPGVARTRTITTRDLRVVVGAPRGHAMLVALSVLALTLGLVTVLLLNTWMAQGAFELTSLRDRADQLADTQAALQHTIDTESAPAELAKRALEQGMVPASTAAFLRLSDGQVLGVAEPATGDRGFTVVAQAVPAAPAAASAPTAAASVPQTGTTVSTEGTITRTTVVAVVGDQVETTVTSVDSATGATTSTTTRTPILQAAVPAVAPAAAPAAAPSR